MTPGRFLGTGRTARGIAPVLAGALFMGLNAAVGAFDAVIVRLVAGELHTFEIVFFRNFFSFVFLLFLLRHVGPSLTRSPNWPVHVMRAALKLASLIAYFYAVTLLPLAIAITLAFTTPLFVSLGSILFLGERPRTMRIAALCAGFAGVYVVLRPDAVPIGAGAAMALVAAIGLAGVALLMKLSSSRESALTIVWFNLVVTVPLAFVVALPVWTTPSLYALGLLALQGAAGLAAQFAFARAMSLADASLLIMVDFIRLPLAIGLGLVLFGEAVEMRVLIGGGIILGALVLLLRHERATELP